MYFLANEIPYGRSPLSRRHTYVLDSTNNAQTR